MNADFVLCSGSLAAVLERIDRGYQIISAPSLRVVEHEARPLFERHLREHGNDSFSARAMMAIAEGHLHQTVRGRTINRDQLVEAWYYHIVYWRLTPTCLAARSFLLQPLCFQVRRQAQTVVCSHDYGFLQEYCPGGRYTAIGDSDELLMIELQARDLGGGIARTGAAFCFVLGRARKSHFEDHWECCRMEYCRASPCV